MPRLLLFGGTTESRELLERGLPALCCVATDYGADLVRGLPNAEVRVGRLDEAGMEALIRSEGITCVIDATHPYALEVTRNIRAACEAAGTPLLRVSREPGAGREGVVPVQSCREAAELLNERQGRVLLTVGSKELREFTAVKDYRTRLFARVLPTAEVLRSCEELGFDPEHVIAMRGPFSAALNRAMLDQIGASILVTKDGGAPGGVEDKLQAAREAGAEVILITRPKEEAAFSTVEEGVAWARRMLGLRRSPLFPLLTDIEGRKVLLVGGGNVALRRAATLLKCGARVLAVSPVFRDDFPREAEWLLRPFEPGDLEGAALAVAASDDRETNRRVGREARVRGIPVSVADAAEECSFFFPSLVVADGASVSVSTGGTSCVLTRRLADRLRTVWGGWVAEETERLDEGRPRTVKRRKIRVGGRGSALAVAQCRIVMEAIAAAHPELELELVTIRTTGDVNMKPFAELTDPAGIKGLFTLELERALLEGEVDLAVHSLKDVPMVLNPSLPLVAFSRREDPRDALIVGSGEGPIGCSSARRRLQLADLFPGRTVEPVRGNVATRLRKLDEGQFSMLVLAASGLKRLGLEGRIARFFSTEEMLPAAGQGILACQGRSGEDYGYLDAVNDRDSEDRARAERGFVAALGGGCALPVAAHAVLAGDELTLTGLYMDEGRGIRHRGTLTGPRTEAEELGRKLAQELGR